MWCPVSERHIASSGFILSKGKKKKKKKKFLGRARGPLACRALFVSPRGAPVPDQSFCPVHAEKKSKQKDTHTHKESGRWLEPAARRRQAAVITCTAALPATPTPQRARRRSVVPGQFLLILCQFAAASVDMTTTTGETPAARGEKKKHGEKSGGHLFF